MRMRERERENEREDGFVCGGHERETERDVWWDGIISLSLSRYDATFFTSIIFSYSICVGRAAKKNFLLVCSDS